VVLIPGIFGAAYGYRRVLPLLTERGYRAIVVEPLGLGRSAKPERADYSLEAQSERVEAVLGHLGLTGAILVAHSTNASIAYRLAYRRPDLVSGVVSLEGGPAERATTSGFRRAMTFVPWIKWFGGAKRIRNQVRKGLIKASGDTTWVTEDVVDGYTAAAQTDLDGTLKAFLSMAGSKEPERLRPHLPDIRCPVWLLLGGAPHQGGPSAKEVETLRSSLAALSVDTIPGVGLYIQEERPGAVVGAVERVAAALPARLGRGTPATRQEWAPPAGGSALRPQTAPAAHRW
jgi:pimeloyl-ACP methyl ester carboxylesterase